MMNCDFPDKEMRILMVVAWHGEHGGVTRVFNTLARYLRSRKHRLMFFHPSKTVVMKHGLTTTGFDGVWMRLNMPLGYGKPRILRLLAFPFLFTSGLLQLIWFLRKNRI